MRLTNNEIEELFQKENPAFTTDYNRILHNLESIRYDVVELHIMGLIGDSEMEGLIEAQLAFVKKMKELKKNKVDKYKLEMMKNGY